MKELRGCREEIREGKEGEEKKREEVVERKMS